MKFLWIQQVIGFIKNLNHAIGESKTDIEKHLSVSGV